MMTATMIPTNAETAHDVQPLQLLEPLEMPSAMACAMALASASGLGFPTCISADIITESHTPCTWYNPTAMLKPSNACETLRHWCAKWNAYSRAYTLYGFPNPLWFVALHGRGPLFRRIAESVCQHLARGTVLDVGTGSGQLTSLLAEMAPNVSIIGIDIEQCLIHDGQEHALQNTGRDRISLVLADVQALPFSKDSFDMVVSTMSLHQWRDEGKAIAELHRVLRDGGIALVVVGIMFVGRTPLFHSAKNKSRYVEDVFGSAGFKDIQTEYHYADLWVAGRK